MIVEIIGQSTSKLSHKFLSLIDVKDSVFTLVMSDSRPSASISLLHLIDSDWIDESS